MWRSRRVDYSLASEIVSFLRTLLIAPDWQPLLAEKLRTNLSALSALVQSLGQRIAASAKDKDKGKATGASAEGGQNAELAGQQRIMAVLAVLGGWNEDLRVGGKVRLRGEARPDNAGESTSATVGTVISFLSPSTVKVLLRATDNDAQERRMRTYAVDELTPVTEIELPSGIFSLTEDTLGIMHSFLEKSNACLYAEEATGTDPSPATLLYAQIRSRLLKAELLMSFVGLPREFCIHALLHNNDNVEEAASWSFDNFNNWSAEQAHAQALSIQQERRSSHSDESFDSSSSSSSSSTGIRSIDYPGEAYAFVDDAVESFSARHGTIVAASTPLEVSRLRVGTKCVVTDRAVDATDLTGWVDAKYRAYLAQPIPDLRQAGEDGSAAGDIMHILWAQLQRLCRTGETDFLDLLLAESASLLKESAAFSSRHALVSESEHPHGTEDFVKEFAIPDAMGLVVTFDRRCKLSDADSLTIYLDEKRTKPLRRFTGTSLSQFHPVVIASNRFWLQFQ
ncbi:uncharacterized protein ACA1_032840, partial [Acanthamoeba castellanii str. Neff]